MIGEAPILDVDWMAHQKPFNVKTVMYYVREKRDMSNIIRVLYLHSYKYTVVDTVLNKMCGNIHSRHDCINNCIFTYGQKYIGLFEMIIVVLTLWRWNFLLNFSTPCI